ncbi:hypothetical protein GIB67_033123 [Kingdonia uniflora]|uniref:RING-type domain-containing protein n=1 Tax=Kingdonia uniflora TaxID=39325 RepID=A0A7J7MYL0_9MAGN|nr:hypothetical protein GIB67_033123 [Kingdonia uniflora]
MLPNRRHLSFQAWQEDSFDQAPQGIGLWFRIEMRVRRKYHWVNYGEPIDVVEAPAIAKTFMVDPLSLTSNSGSSDKAICHMLDSMDVEIKVRDDMIMYFHSFALLKVIKYYKLQVILPLVFEIKVVKFVPYENDEETDTDEEEDDEEDEDGEVINDSISAEESEDDKINFGFTEEEKRDLQNRRKLVPATRSSIEALEKVRFDVTNMTEDCAICSRNFFTGMIVTKMPCSHIFHGDCIARWLGGSNLCPLCDFEMPTN